MLDSLKNIRKYLYWLVWGLVAIILVSFTNRKQKDRVCEQIHVHVDEQLENFFIERDDVIGLMTERNRKIIVGKSKQAINVKRLEDLILANNFVLEASVSSTHTGDLIVRVKENRPVSRVFTSGKSFYLDNTGKRLPLSKNYTSRNVVVMNQMEASKAPDFYQNEGAGYMDLINFVANHEFWKKQVAEIRIDKKGRVFLYTHVGDQTFRFGYPEDIEAKFEKLNLFFKKIAPSVGWNKYKIVKLEFKDQIVCE